MNYEQTETCTLHSANPEINYRRSSVEFPKIVRSVERERERNEQEQLRRIERLVCAQLRREQKLRASYKPTHVTLYTGLRDASNYVTIPRRYSSIKSSSNNAKCSAHTSSYNGCPIIFSRSSFEYRATWKFSFVRQLAGESLSNCNPRLFAVSFGENLSLTRKRENRKKWCDDVTRHTLEEWNRFEIQEGRKRTDKSPTEGKSLDDKNHLPTMERTSEPNLWRSLKHPLKRKLSAVGLGLGISLIFQLFFEIHRCFYTA